MLTIILVFLRHQRYTTHHENMLPMTFDVPKQNLSGHPVCQPCQRSRKHEA